MFSSTNAVLFVFSFSTIQLSNVCEALCGKPYFKPIRLSEGLNNNRISNGIEARKHSHPWQALVRVRFGNATRRCGGSLIDWGSSNASDLVLTAAHCLMDANVLLAPYEIMEEVQFYLKRLRHKITMAGSRDVFLRGKYIGVPIVNASQVSVSLGLHDTRALNENMQLLDVVGLAVGHYHQYTNKEDVGLLKLERKVVYNKFIQGICLPYPKENLPAIGYTCYVTGWGFLDEKMTEGRRLQQIEVDIFEKSKCNSRVNEKTMFCAGSKVNNVGTCSGDSGGPLACQKRGQFILYGVVSFSMKGHCSTIDDPTVFTRVPAVLKWVKKEISELASDTTTQSK